jgi:hypothetical protein
MGLLADLLTAEELALAERALIAGVPAEHVHRMLLALTPGGADVGPWAGLLGCCRPAIDAEGARRLRARDGIRCMLGVIGEGRAAAAASPIGSHATDRSPPHAQPRPRAASACGRSCGGCWRPATPAASRRSRPLTRWRCCRGPSTWGPTWKRWLPSWCGGRVSGNDVCVCVCARVRSAMKCTRAVFQLCRCALRGNHAPQGSEPLRGHTGWRHLAHAPPRRTAPSAAPGAWTAARTFRCSGRCRGATATARPSSAARSRPRSRTRRCRRAAAWKSCWSAPRRCTGARQRDVCVHTMGLGHKPTWASKAYSQTQTDTRTRTRTPADTHTTRNTQPTHTYSHNAPQRELVLVKRALADQRKHEAERLEAALRDQQRAIARRGARPLSLLDRFLRTKWGDNFAVGVFACGGWGGVGSV